MKKVIVCALSFITLSINAQKDIVLPQDSTKRTWDFFKYFIAPSSGPLNDVFEPSACLKTAEKYYNESNDKFEKLWSDFNAGDKSYKKIKNAEKQTSNTCKSHAYDASGLKLGIQNTTDKCALAKNYFLIRGYSAFVSKSKLLYPSNEVIAKASDDIKAVLDESGNQDNLKAIEQKNKADKLAKVEPPKAFGSNPEWEKWFKDYFIKEYVGYKFIKQYLRSKEWFVERNEITSVIIDRKISSTIAATKPDGSCVLVDLLLIQNYEGGKYGSSYFLKSAEAQQQVLCEKVK